MWVKFSASNVYIAVVRSHINKVPTAFVSKYTWTAAFYLCLDADWVEVGDQCG